MEIKRVFLYFALALVSLSIWHAWEEEMLPKGIITHDDVTAEVTLQQPVVETANEITQQAQTADSKLAAIITVNTDVLTLKVDLNGGNIISAGLLRYPEALHSDRPFQLLSRNKDTYYVAQSGLTGLGRAMQLTADKKIYQLEANQDQLEIPLRWQSKEGVSVVKTLRLQRGSYVVDVSYDVHNQSAKTWYGHAYTQLQRRWNKHAKSMFQSYIGFTGAALSTPEKPFKKIKFSDFSGNEIATETKGGWIAMIQHYFLTSWIPPKEQNVSYYSRMQGQDVYNVGWVGPGLSVLPDQHLTATIAKLYIGPKLQSLDEVAPGLRLSLDFGWLFFISEFLFFVLKFIHQWMGNWGWAIVLLTLTIKLCFFKLSAKSYRSMSKMKKLQPKLERIRERYADDREELSKQTFALYRDEKVNPLSGCLPILIQIPVFIALYWVLMESVQLRQAPFVLWIHDLSAKDPYYVLPLIMGLTMFIQQKLNPPPPDPVQAQVMAFLPIVFTVLFLSFPSGLVLYWVVNNTLSILQQWVIARSIEHGAATKQTKKT